MCDFYTLIEGYKLNELLWDILTLDTKIVTLIQ